MTTIPLGAQIMIGRQADFCTLYAYLIGAIRLRHIYHSVFYNYYIVACLSMGWFVLMSEWRENKLSFVINFDIFAFGVICNSITKTTAITTTINNKMESARKTVLLFFEKSLSIRFVGALVPFQNLGLNYFIAETVTIITE